MMDGMHIFKSAAYTTQGQGFSGLLGEHQPDLHEKYDYIEQEHLYAKPPIQDGASQVGKGQRERYIKL